MSKCDNAVCVYGGHYGSEGKGSMAEWHARAAKQEGRKLAVFGENSPNSGHTCSLGKTRNLPAASFYADVVVLGPDSVIDPHALEQDCQSLDLTRQFGHDPVRSCPEIFIHEHAAFFDSESGSAKNREAGVVQRISSTGSGSGAARYEKNFDRTEDSIVGHFAKPLLNQLDKYPVRIINNSQYVSMVNNGQLQTYCKLFECSQGTLLDVNFGRYPYVTSRTTLPRAATERNGLGHISWKFIGVYRTYPIRTGGPSGPTGGVEISFEELGLPPEIATVTKRIRRIFEFSRDDFMLSLSVSRPDMIAFTHLDYIGVAPTQLGKFRAWLDYRGVDWDFIKQAGVKSMFLSNQLGQFTYHSL